MALRRRTHRIGLTASALAVGLVAGSTPATAGGTDRGRTIDWGLSGCHGLVVLIPVAAETLEPHLPEGFTAVMPDSVAATLPPDPRLQAVLGLELLECDEGAGLHGPIEGLDYASFWTFVDPPAALEGRGHDLSFVKWDTLVPDEDRRDLLQDHGLAARDGDVTIDEWHPLALESGVAFDAGWTFADGEEYRFSGAAAAPMDFQGTFIEYTTASAGLAEWETTFHAPTAFGGAGIAELAPDGWPAEVLGTTRADAYFLVPVDLDFTDATLMLPARSRRPA